MSRHPDFWRLPGPKRLINSLRDAMSRRQSVFIQEPLDPAALAAEVGMLIDAEGLDLCCSLMIGGSETFLRQLQHRTLSRATTGQGISRELHNTVVILTGTLGAVDVSAIDDFARSAAQRGDAAAPVVVAIFADAVPDGLGTRWLRWTTKGCIGPLDVTAFAAGLIAGPEDVLTRVAPAVAIEVGAWDLEIVERIFDAGPAVAIRPDLQVDRWADPRIDDWRCCRSARWEAGQFDVWNQEVSAHPLFLATHAFDRLVRRVWRGQLMILFPWIEEWRRELIRVHRRTLLSAGLDHDMLDLLDWGPLCMQLAQVPRPAPALANGLRLLRNELAHGRPVLWEEVRSAAQAASRWSTSSAFSADSDRRST